MNTYIGFWTLKVKCTQYGFFEQATFKNAREIFFEVERDQKFSTKISAGLPRGVDLQTLVLTPLPLKVHEYMMRSWRGRVQAHAIWHELYNMLSN